MFIKKIEYEEVQSRETVFYKEVVKRNVSATQLESMRATFSAGKSLPEKRISQQYLLSPPDSKPDSQPNPYRSQSLESKSVSWSVAGLSEPPRFILKRLDYSYEPA